MAKQTLNNHPKRQRCEVWTRVMGYHRPTVAFNPGKLSEHNDRCFFIEDKENIRKT
ncbi:anaerobic ribonucleoside-triphosphate reductase [Spartinivicinus ruber]|uniref:anaerobic ribonucleoside-triphosphate reductase n=1 Tax=Spartinivicinus ruber TaxID=2683272 RepID=UPI0013D2A5FC|nr:anaerobic ribonucleoside-triphosphate reductase [Spartinivicinus ruber]